MRNLTVKLSGIIAVLVFTWSYSTSNAAEIVLKYGAFGSGKTPFSTVGTGPFRKKVAELTGGKVEIKRFLNTLGGPRQLYKNAKDGIADIAWVIAGASRGFKFPRSTVLSMPNILDGYTNTQANTALWRLYEKGLIKPDYSDVIPLGFASMSATHIVTKDKEPTRVENLKGMKIAVTSGLTAQTVKALGAIPVFTPVTGLYQAMDRGTVNGLMIGFTAVQGFKLDEVSNRHVVVPMSTPLVFIGMNKKKFDGLPGYAKKAILSASGIKLSQALGRAGDGMIRFTRGRLKKSPKQKIIDLPEAQKAPWRAAVKPIVKRWVKSTPNGAAILAAYRQELENAKRGK